MEEIDLNSDEYYMHEALKEAYKALEDDEVPVGAVIVCRKKIIARAYNRTERLVDVTAHAEMQAFTSASNFLGGKYLDECTLYVTLEPCVMCAGASMWAQLAKIVYGAPPPPEGGSLPSRQRHLISKILHPRTVVVGGVLEKECADLLKEFFKKKR